jgi:hypothetical protein
LLAQKRVTLAGETGEEGFLGERRHSMRARRLGLFVVPLLVFAATVASTGGGAVRTGEKATAASPPAKKINLATYRGGVLGYRATAATSTGASRLDVASSRSRAYVSHLRSVQHAFAQRLARALPGTRVQRTYQVVLNGLAVKMTRRQAAVARKGAWGSRHGRKISWEVGVPCNL